MTSLVSTRTSRSCVSPTSGGSTGAASRATTAAAVGTVDAAAPRRRSLGSPPVALRRRASPPASRPASARDTASRSKERWRGGRAFPLPSGHFRRNRVMTGGTERVAPCEASGGQPGPETQSVASDRFRGVVCAGRKKPTRPGKIWRNEKLIGANQPKPEPGRQRAPTADGGVDVRARRGNRLQE